MQYGTQHYHIGEEEINSGDLQKVIDPLWDTVSIYDGEQQYNDDLRRFSLPQRYIFAIQWYFAEVYNGGHDQFFFNSTGIVWKDALEGFKTIGMDKCADILSEAAKRMGGSPSMDREERWEQQEEHDAEFDDLDDIFYGLSTEEIEKPMLDYIHAHAADFYFDGDIEMPVYSNEDTAMDIFDT